MVSHLNILAKSDEPEGKTDFRLVKNPALQQLMVNVTNFHLTHVEIVEKLIGFENMTYGIILISKQQKVDMTGRWIFHSIHNIYQCYTITTFQLPLDTSFGQYNSKSSIISLNCFSIKLFFLK